MRRSGTLPCRMPTGVSFFKGRVSCSKCCLLTGEVKLPVAARLKKLGSWGGAIGVANLQRQSAIPGAWRVLGTRP